MRETGISHEVLPEVQEAMMRRYAATGAEPVTEEDVIEHPEWEDIADRRPGWRDIQSTKDTSCHPDLYE